MFKSLTHESNKLIVDALYEMMDKPTVHTTWQKLKGGWECKIEREKYRFVLILMDQHGRIKECAKVFHWFAELRPMKYYRGWIGGYHCIIRDPDVLTGGLHPRFHESMHVEWTPEMRIL